MQVDAQGNGAQGFRIQSGRLGAVAAGRHARTPLTVRRSRMKNETHFADKIRGAHKLSVGSGPLHLAAVPRLPFQAFRLEGLSSCGARRN